MEKKEACQFATTNILVLLPLSSPGPTIFTSKIPMTPAESDNNTPNSISLLEFWVCLFWYSSLSKWVNASRKNSRRKWKKSKRKKAISKTLKKSKGTTIHRRYRLEVIKSDYYKWLVRSTYESILNLIVLFLLLLILIIDMLHFFQTILFFIIFDVYFLL